MTYGLIFTKQSYWFQLPMLEMKFNNIVCFKWLYLSHSSQGFNLIKLYLTVALLVNNNHPPWSLQQPEHTQYHGVHTLWRHFTWKITVFTLYNQSLHLVKPPHLCWLTWCCSSPPRPLQHPPTTLLSSFFCISSLICRVWTNLFMTQTWNSTAPIFDRKMLAFAW